MTKICQYSLGLNRHSYFSGVRIATAKGGDSGGSSEPDTPGIQVDNGEVQVKEL